MEDITSLKTRIRMAQDTSKKIVIGNLVKRPGQWKVDGEGAIWVKNRLYVPRDNIL